jgi:hypothetical protein
MGEGTSVVKLYSVLGEIRDERVRQIEDLGFDEAHDERVGVHGLAWLAAMRSVALCSEPMVAADPVAAREKLIEAAAIAVAAVQYLDRQES